MALFLCSFGVQKTMCLAMFLLRAQREFCLTYFQNILASRVTSKGTRNPLFKKIPQVCVLNSC